MPESTLPAPDRLVVITARDQIRGVAAAWEKAYRAGNDRHKEVGRRLAGLDGETATEEDVTAIIGNNSWTSLSCDVCERGIDVGVRMGDPPDYESATIFVCLPCLEFAVAAIRLSDPPF